MLDPAPAPDQDRIPDGLDRVASGVPLATGQGEDLVDGHRTIDVYPDKTPPPAEVAATPLRSQVLDLLPRREHDMLCGPAAALRDRGHKDLEKPIGGYDKRRHELTISTGKITAPRKDTIKCRMKPLEPARIIPGCRDAKGCFEVEVPSGACLKRPDQPPEARMAGPGIIGERFDRIQGREQFTGVTGDALRRNLHRERLFPQPLRAEIGAHVSRVAHPQPECAFHIKSCDIVHMVMIFFQAVRNVDKHPLLKHVCFDIALNALLAARRQRVYLLPRQPPVP